MAPRNLVLAALFAATALAGPASPAKPQNAKRFEGGRCSFHMQEDSGRLEHINGADHKIAMQFWDGKHNDLGGFGPEQHHADLTDIEFTPDGFDQPIIMNALNEEGNSNHLQGWAFKWGEDEWDTNDENYCHAGKEADPDSMEHNNRWTRKYDCGFAC